MLDQIAQRKLNVLANKTNSVLLKISSVFPFDFFPKDIIIDENKISIINRVFFGSEQIQSVNIKDASHVTVETDIFFASIRITDRFYVQKPIVVKFLKKGDALQARRIIQGLMIGTQDQIDFSKLHSEEVREKAEEIGKAREAG